MKYAKPDMHNHARANDPVWQFLAEYPLGEFMVDAEIGDETTPRLLFHLIQDLGIAPECLIKIERALIEFAKKVMVRSKQGNISLPFHLRLYCQKKMIESVRLTRTSSFYSKASTTGLTPIIQHSELKMNGGWGYFLIERGGGFAAGSSADPHHWIDLYLYKEGE